MTYDPFNIEAETMVLADWSLLTIHSRSTMYRYFVWVCMCVCVCVCVCPGQPERKTANLSSHIT